MTRYNDIHNETFPYADKIESFPIFTMRCENCDISLLGDTLRSSNENDNIKKHRKHYCEGLVDST